jgi:hypothetical protein
MSKAGADPSGRRDPDHDPGADKEGREQILRVHARDVPLDDDVDLGAVAATTVGMVGTDLANLVVTGFSQVSEGTRQRVAEEIKRIAGDAHGRTVRLLSENRHRLETLAEELARAETLDAPHAYAAAGIDWPAGRAVEREESAPGIPGRHGSTCLMLSPARAPRITPRSAP